MGRVRLLRTYVDQVRDVLKKARLKVIRKNIYVEGDTSEGDRKDLSGE